LKNRLADSRTNSHTNAHKHVLTDSWPAG